jgi:hypothetical protein
VNEPTLAVFPSWNTSGPRRRLRAECCAVEQELPSTPTLSVADTHRDRAGHGPAPGAVIMSRDHGVCVIVSVAVAGLLAASRAVP